MAKKPAQDLSLDGLERGTPEYEHKLRLIKEDEERRKNTIPKEKWTEVHVDNRHDKGGKCLLKTRMSNGNVHSLYLGRFHAGGKDLLKQYAEKGVKRREARQE